MGGGLGDGGEAAAEFGLEGLGVDLVVRGRQGGGVREDAETVGVRSGDKVLALPQSLWSLKL